MISVVYKSIRVNGNLIYCAPEKIDTTHILRDSIIVLYDPVELISKAKLTGKEIPLDTIETINRNIIMMDYTGNIIWQIKAMTQIRCNPWTVIGTDAPNFNVWYAATSEGYQYDININDGSLSNVLYMK